MDDTSYLQNEINEMIDQIDDIKRLIRIHSYIRKVYLIHNEEKEKEKED